MKRKKTMSKKLRNLLLAMLALAPASGLAGPTGQALSFTCAGCHGTDGSSVGPSMPAIAGMDPEVFVDAMKAYRADDRNPTIMNRMAKAYSDEQFKEMAWFFASQRLHLFPQAHDAALVAQGAKLHEKHCEKCHEKGGRPGDAGTLAGQWMPYLEYTMDDFLTGKRKWPRKMERKVDAVLADDGENGIQALIHYYGSQDNSGTEEQKHD
jgi:cytochrome subunit of sulfide dehydrogenase